MIKLVKVSKETEQKINQLQLYEQSLQNLLLQRQQFQAQLNEVEAAIKELETTKEAYRIIGNVMVLSKKDELKKELESKREMLNIRIKSITKQENQIKEKALQLQSEVMKNIEGK